MLSRWLPIVAMSLVCLVHASPQPQVAPATGISVHQAVQVLQKESLYELCAEYLKKSVYGTTRTITASSTATRTVTVIPSTTITWTVSQGTSRTTVPTTVTTTSSSAFATDTEYVFQFTTTTTRTTTTLSATTVYTPTSRVQARRELKTFPPPLPSFTSILSAACSSLLAGHTCTTTSTAVTTTTTTHTAPTTTATHFVTVPRTTVTRTSTATSTTVEPYLAITTTTTLLTISATVTRTKYLSTVRAPAQCAPTAYVINADQYIDDQINFESAGTQPDALGCCRVCVSTANCQAWVWLGDPLSSPFGICTLVTGTSPGTCPAPSFNAAFVPICLGQDQNKFSVGLGACTSNINLTGNSCVLGPNQ